MESKKFVEEYVEDHVGRRVDHQEHVAEERKKLRSDFLLFVLVPRYSLLKIDIWQNNNRCGR